MKFGLKRCCKKCPFLIGTPMVLSPGRMLEITEALRNDWTVFPCHETTNNSRDEDDGREGDGEDGYRYDGSEQACAGALAYTLREYGMLPVMARIACARGDLKLDTIRANFPKLEKPGGWETY